MKTILWLAVIAAVALGPLGCCKKFGGGKKGPTAPLSTREGGVRDIEGSYRGSGTNPGGGSYKCDVDISKAGSVYRVKWYFDGRLGYEGTGVLKRNTFVVGFANDQGYGVVAYTVKGDGTLDGTWTGKGNSRVGTEKLTRK